MMAATQKTRPSVQRPAAVAALVLEALPSGARGLRFLDLSGRLPDIGLARLAAVLEALVELGLARKKTRGGETWVCRAVALGELRGRRGAGGRQA